MHTACSSPDNMQAQRDLRVLLPHYDALLGACDISVGHSQDAGTVMFIRQLLMGQLFFTHLTTPSWQIGQMSTACL